MTTTKKIIAWAIVALILLPSITVFNANPETPLVNLFGAAWAYLSYRYAGRILPAWIIEYLKESSHDDSDELE